MKKRIVLCLLALALLSVMTGCGKKKDADPLTVTLWHVYGGEVDSPLNGLIEQFNSTIGVEQNIRVKVELVSNSGSIHKSVLAAANSDPGAPSLPDVLFRADGAVELLNQTIQRGIHLAAIDMPQRHGQRVCVLFLSAPCHRGTEHPGKGRAGQQQRQHS